MNAARRTRVVAFAAVAAMLGAGPVTACASNNAATTRETTTTRVVRTVDIVVPPGTQRRLQAGEKVEIMPATLKLRVGDTLHIRNDDYADQVVGPYTVKGKSEMRMTYGVAGTYQGFCAVSPGEQFLIVVEP